MIGVSAKFICGVMLGVELFSGEDIEEPSIDYGIVFDLLILRLEIVTYHQIPTGMA